MPAPAASPRTASVRRLSLRPARWGRWPIVAALAAVLAGGLGIGSRRTPLPPASGSDLHGRHIVAPATRPGGDQVLRVATFNIHSAIGLDDRRDPRRIAEQLMPFDVVGLNEVRGWVLSDEQGADNDAGILGQLVGARWLFAPTERQWWYDHFGNGLLSRMPAEQWLRLPLPGSQTRGHRNVLLTRVRFQGRSVNVLVTHVDRRQDRVPQLRFLRGLFLSLQEPAILMGDLNTTASDPELRPLLDTPGVTDAIAAHLDRPMPERIDWILTRGLRVTGSGVEDRGTSDHPLIWADLHLP